MVNKGQVSYRPFIWKIIVVVFLVVAVVAVFRLKKEVVPPMPKQTTPEATVPAANETRKVQPTEKKIPILIDLGAGKCIPCKMMAPILEGLRAEYAGRLQVEFIDVWENPSAGDQYKIRVIPTQIFFDPSGKELFRHVGFMSKEDILSKWKELGFSLEKETGK